MTHVLWVVSIGQVIYKKKDYWEMLPVINPCFEVDIHVEATKMNVPDRRDQRLLRSLLKTVNQNCGSWNRPIGPSIEGSGHCVLTLGLICWWGNL